MGISTHASIGHPPAIREILTTLENAERLFWQSLTAIMPHGEVLCARDSAMALALITALKTSLGASENNGPLLAAGLIGP